jgi:putative flippase GtrA
MNSWWHYPGPYERSRQLLYEFAKFGVIGATGVFVTNAVYDLLFLHPPAIRTV